jgi:hypothetical protein
MRVMATNLRRASAFMVLRSAALPSVRGFGLAIRVNRPLFL